MASGRAGAGFLDEELIHAIGAKSAGVRGAGFSVTSGDASVSEFALDGGTRPPRPGRLAALGPIAAICCQVRVRAWRAAGCSGTVSRTLSAALEDHGRVAFAECGVQRLDFRRRSFLAVFDVATSRGQCRCGTPGGEPLGAVELVVGTAEFPSARFIEGVLPGLGDLARSPQRGTADLVFSEAVDPFDDPGGLTRVKIGTDLGGDPVGQLQSSGGEVVWCRAEAFGHAEVFDRAGDVVHFAATDGTSDEVECHLAAELNRVMMVSHIGAVGQRHRLFEATRLRRFFCLSQDHSPMSQHG